MYNIKKGKNASSVLCIEFEIWRIYISILLRHVNEKKKKNDERAGRTLSFFCRYNNNEQRRDMSSTNWGKRTLQCQGAAKNNVKLYGFGRNVWVRVDL